jgi:SAM-dependent methyltransferase
VTNGERAHDSADERERPSVCITRFAPLVPSDGSVLDVACGGGRHTALFLDRGNRVVAVDRDVSGVRHLSGDANLQVVELDLETGEPLPFAAHSLAAVVVTNYLHRPILGDLVAMVAPGGVLLYETFAVGNERFGRPRRPEFLLQPGELLDAVRGQLRVIAYEDVVVDDPRPAAVQRIAAVREGAADLRRR